jgi:DNA-binding MarR family transcriptional regulator
MADSEPNLVDALVQSSFEVQGVLRQVAARHDLSVVALRLLGVLRDREPGVIALARHLELDKSSVTGLVDRAEGRGLVKRFADPDDGRAIRVRLTAKGRKLAATGTAEVAEQMATLVADLSETERRRLATLLSGIGSRASGSPDGRPRSG